MLFVNIIYTILIPASCWSPFNLYCYRCVSTHPGCGTPFNWLWYWGEVCPEVDDKCVKITERKGGNIRNFFYFGLFDGMNSIQFPLPEFNVFLLNKENEVTGIHGKLRNVCKILIRKPEVR